MPTPKANPPRVMRLIVNPPKYMSAKVAMIEMGMEREIATVLLRLRRKRAAPGSPGRRRRHRPGHVLDRSLEFP